MAERDLSRFRIETEVYDHGPYLLVYDKYHSDDAPFVEWPMDEALALSMSMMNEYVTYKIYAYSVDCPHCGALDGQACVETGSDGPIPGEVRSPHEERTDLAREIHPWTA